jgi:hypothetical protein
VETLIKFQIDVGKYKFKKIYLYKKKIQKWIFFNDLSFSIAYFIMYCKVLAAVLEHPI